MENPHFGTKIFSMDDLVAHLSERREGRRVACCHGDFEVLHPGYLNLLQQARQHGDLLVVSLTPDAELPGTSTYRNFDTAARADILAALGLVDYVVVGSGGDGSELIRRLRPECFVQPDSEVPKGAELEAARQAGSEVVKVPPAVVGFAQPVSNPLSAYSPETAAYLEDFSRRHGAEGVLGFLERARGLKVLVVGEAILDEYHYCETIGKSGKEPILATRYLHSERFAGGILAVANNVAAFADQVTVLTVLGAENGLPDPSESFIRESLDPRVSPVFLHQEGAPTILKRRFVEQYPLQKLFEVYFLKHMEENGPLAHHLCVELQRLVPQHDVVIVTDYGHGMIVPEAVEILCREARFLAVNTQANADNQGFNTISKYPRADFISLSERELRLEVRSKGRDTGSIMEEVAEKLGCGTMLITRGKQGNLLYQRGSGISTAPSLSNRIVDRVGAGDAVLSAASLCVAQGAGAEVLGFLSNVVGAFAVATVGHRSSLNLDKLKAHINAILG